MGINTNKLKAKIVEMNMTQSAVAKAIGVDSSTFARKMKLNGATFTVGQMHKLVDILHMSTEEAEQIFLSENLR